MAAGHRFRDAAFSASPARTERARVVVVGGGVAGLAAAWRLARAGVEDLVILDLAGEIGGTSRSGEMALERGGALRCPFGAHYLPQPRAEQKALVAFLRDVGIAGKGATDGRVTVPDSMLVRDPEERIAGLGGFFEEGLWLRSGATSGDEEELLRFESEIEALIRTDAQGARLFDLPIAHSSPELVSLDGMSALDWMSERNILSERMRWYLEYATRDDFGASLKDTSAWALLHYFTARADLETKESAAYLTWPEGNARLVQHLAEASGARIETGSLALRATQTASGAQVEAIAPDGSRVSYAADAVVLATPQFVTKRLLAEDPAAKARASFRYGPWVVANLHLAERPSNRGFSYAWDSVIHGSKSLGYVDASHQLDRSDSPETVWSWYLPVTDSDEAAARQALLSSDWETWRDSILHDLRSAHSNIDDVVKRIDVWRWGHGMVKPTPGLLWGGARAAAARPIGKIHFAHSDLSGMALFEEAQWQGTRAAEEILEGFGIDSESLL